jgi:hypothetical protein
MLLNQLPAFIVHHCEPYPVKKHSITGFAQPTPEAYLKQGININYHKYKKMW